MFKRIRGSDLIIGLETILQFIFTLTLFTLFLFVYLDKFCLKYKLSLKTA